MIEISTELIKETVYELCLKANICLCDYVYSKILEAYNSEQNEKTKNYLKYILQNAKIAYEKKMPLCQDTGQVIVFLEIGQNIFLKGEFILNAINNAVKKCYLENFFRKSVVENAVFNRQNTKTNTPCLIYTKYTDTDEVKITVLIKGAGSENKSYLAMLLPTNSEEDIVEKCAELVVSVGMNACPPMFIGIGIGASSEKALLMSKEALIETNFSEKENMLGEKIKEAVNKQAPVEFKNCFALDVKIKTTSTHIACMPVGITINCHSDRYSSALIKEGRVYYEHKIPDFKKFEIDENEVKEVNTNNLEQLKLLKAGECVNLTGELYVARDMAHKKLVELILKNKELPFDIKEKIIFYAGPCPAKEGEVIGSIGPTTAGRMDKYAIELYKKGIYATIGKGERNNEVKKYIEANEKRYLSVQGGIAAALANKVKKCKIIAFEELGAEAIYKIYVEKFPLKVEI